MLSLYVLFVASVFSLSEASVSWPDGKYCLPMPKNQQCPAGWSKGIREHDTEDDKGSTYCYLKKQGWVPYNKNYCGNLGWGFCCKTRDYPRTGKTWPRGSYCIFRKGGHCPPHFHGGYIYWDDEDSGNINKQSGTLPDGSYGRNTRIYFCCRNDPATLFGTKLSLTGLPRCSETILMRYKGSCPKVFGYIGPYTGFLQWDNEDNQNQDERLGAYPDGQKTVGSGIKIEFCSFTSHRSC